MSANDHQVDGNHYRGAAIQHWDLMMTYDVRYLPGNATKYLCRWRSKNGVTDLRKARHYVEKMLEIYDTSPQKVVVQDVIDMCEGYLVPMEEIYLVSTILNFKTREDLKYVRTCINVMIATNSPGTPEDGGHHYEEA